MREDKTEGKKDTDYRESRKIERETKNDKLQFINNMFPKTSIGISCEIKQKILPLMFSEK